MVSPDVEIYNLHPIVIIVLPIPLTIIATIAIALRLWVRCFISRTFGRDDVLLICAHVCFIAACGDFMAIGFTEYYEGLVPIIKLAILSVMGIVLYLVNQIFFKLSLAFFFLRIAHKRWHRATIITSVVIYVCFDLAILVVSITQCGNIATIDIGHLKCLDWDTIQAPLNYFGAALNAAVDWIFAAISISVVRGLSLDTRSKISVYGIVLLATAGSIVSVVRIPYIPGLRLDSRYYSQENDVIAYLSLIEAAIGIVVASMAVMRPLALRLLHHARSALSCGDKSRETATSQSSGKRERDSSEPSQGVVLFQALPDPGHTVDSVAMAAVYPGGDVEKGRAATATYDYAEQWNR